MPPWRTCVALVWPVRAVKSSCVYGWPSGCVRDDILSGAVYRGGHLLCWLPWAASCVRGCDRQGQVYMMRCGRSIFCVVRHRLLWCGLGSASASYSTEMSLCDGGLQQQHSDTGLHDLMKDTGPSAKSWQVVLLKEGLDWDSHLERLEVLLSKVLIDNTRWTPSNTRRPRSRHECTDNTSFLVLYRILGWPSQNVTKHGIYWWLCIMLI